MKNNHCNLGRHLFARNPSLRSVFTGVALLLIATPNISFADPSQEKHMDVEMGASSKLDQAMKDGNQKMESVTMTGNVDEDFVRMMIPHHQAAIDAARIQIKEGKDPEIKKMAQKNIRAQEQDVAKLQAWLKKKGSPTG